MHQAIKHELLGGDVLYTDSTHMKANANKKKCAVISAFFTFVGVIEACSNGFGQCCAANMRKMGAIAKRR